MGTGETEAQNEVVIISNVYGDVCIRKARRKRQKLLIKELLYDYANNTTLHGLPYVTRTGLTLIEKIFWLITFLASVALCLWLISKVWYKWQTSPVIVTVSEQLVPVSMVPFPSVTICPQSKCKVSVYNFTNEKMVLDKLFWSVVFGKTINDTMKKRIDKFNDLTGICKLHSSFTLSKISPHNHSDYSVVENILQVAPNLSDIFFLCFSHGKAMDCEKLFSIALTSEGVCYNMNSLAATEIFRSSLQKEFQYLYTTTPSKGWSVKHGYNQSFTSKNSYEDPGYYPAPGVENGEKPALEVVLKHTERDPLCNGLNSGFKVYIQHPTDLPQSSLYYYAVIKDQVSSMALSFSILNTSESLRRYDSETRQCYFPDERHLQYFSLYTANNCMIECLSNITSKICGCVGFYMPYNHSNKICTGKDVDCMKKAQREMRHQELVGGGERCHCLPSCNAVDYEAEIIKSEFNMKRFFITRNSVTINRAHDINKLFKEVKFSKLEMYFKRPRFLSMRRSELFGLIDFLANCGGLLGLFLGFSFLSLVELLYFLSLRLCCTIKKDLDEEKGEIEPGKEIYIDKY